MFVSRNPWIIGGLSLTVVAALSACGTTTAANTSAKTGSAKASTAGGSTKADTAFYHGKTLTVIVPYGPGGGYDTYARLLVPYLKADLGLSSVKVENISGGGGLVGANELMAAAPNGLTIGDINIAGAVSSVITNEKGLQFNPAKVNWIGQSNGGPFVMALRPKGPYKNLQDLLKLKGGKQAISMLVPGLGSEEATTSVVQMNVLGIPFKILAGYTGTKSENTGFLRGDGDIISESYSTLYPLIHANEANIAFQEGLTRWSGLPKVPTAIELAKQEGITGQPLKLLDAISAMLTLGKGFAAPNGVPAGQMLALQQAFKSAVNNPQFQAAAKKAKLTPEYWSPASIQSRINQVLSQKAAIQKMTKTS